MDKETINVILENEEHFVGDRVRLKDAKNGMKATVLCEIAKIKSNNEIHLVSVMDGSKVIVSLDEIMLM